MDRRSGVIAPDTRALRALPRKGRRCPASRNVPAAKWAIKATSMRLAIGGSHTATVSAWREGTLIAPAKRAEHMAWRGWRAIGRSSASRQPRSRSCPRSIPAGRARRGNAGVRPRRGTPGMGRLGIATKPGLADVERGMEGAGRAIVARGRNDCPRRPAQATQPESGCSSSRRASLPSSSSHSRPSGACTTARMRSPMS